MEVHPLNLHMGKMLRRKRNVMDLTQLALAEMIGVRHQQIQKYECGQCAISGKRLYELSRALGVSTEYFFAGYTEENPADQRLLEAV